MSCGIHVRLDVQSGTTLQNESGRNIWYLNY